MTSNNKASDRGSEHGPLFSFIDIYLKLLLRRGYKRSTTYPDELLLDDFDQWLARGGIRVRDLNETVAARFMRCHMRRRRTRRAAKWATIHRLLAMLRAEGKIPAPPPPKRTEADKLVDDFGHYLATERGFVTTTVAGYRRAVRVFLAKCIGSEAIDLGKIDAPFADQLCASIRPETHSDHISVDAGGAAVVPPVSLAP